MRITTPMIAASRQQPNTSLKYAASPAPLIDLTNVLTILRRYGLGPLGYYPVIAARSYTGSVFLAPY
jgi:hypothetical protein